jgi:hypothetical protein
MLGDPDQDPVILTHDLMYKFASRRLMDYVAHPPSTRIHDGKNNVANVPYLIPTDSLGYVRYRLDSSSGFSLNSNLFSRNQ